MTPTETTILSENDGDIRRAFADVCRLYDVSRTLVSAGYARANTAHLQWTHKPPLSDDSTDDSWIASGRAVNDD